jgi:arylsulfatase A-like enzyme
MLHHPTIKRTSASTAANRPKGAKPARPSWLSPAAWTTGAAAAVICGWPHTGNGSQTDRSGPPPNIVLILADDLSPGSVGCYGATKIKTPNIDRLAQEGRMFHNAYAPNSVCSPTRYALLSGRYAWRNERHPKTGVIGADGALAFAPEEPTLPAFLRAMGYTTAVIGKWHLGFGGGDLSARYDWTQPELKPGPLESGFDYFFGLAANAKNEPHLYIENHAYHGRGPGDSVKWVEQPDGGKVLEGWKPGLRWEYQNIAGDTTRKAVEFIERSKDKPFFLFYSSTIPHEPIAPADQFVGTSEAGPYGDFMHELDHHVGTLMDALETAGVLDNTLVILTADNGGVHIDDESPEFMKKMFPENLEAFHRGHMICGDLRGKKHTIYEGGLRVPFLARWPGHIPAGTETKAILSLSDLFATVAAMLGRELPPGAAPDSFNALPLLTGPTDTKIRDSIVLNSAIGNFALRQGDHKLIVKEQLDPEFNGFGENNNQLYNLKDDPSERNNIWSRSPEAVQQLGDLLQKYRRQAGTR